MKQKTKTLTDLQGKRKALLDKYAKKQDLRVVIGKSFWRRYKEFNISYNLREILHDEIVIEFDMPKDWKGTLQDFKNLSWEAINETAINLYKAGYVFEIWEHDGKSPHIHIHDLPITHLEKNKRKKLKELFQKRYVPQKYHKFIDTSLCGIHVIRLEWSNCWKGQYGIKELCYRFNPKKITNITKGEESNE